MADQGLARAANRAMRIARRIRQLSWRERVLAVEATLLSQLFKVILARRGFAGARAVANRLATVTALALPRVRSADQAHRIGELVDLAGTIPKFPAVCLPRSLAAFVMLSRRGLRPRLRIGTVLEGNDLRAHAWVELDGQAITADSTEDGFMPFEGNLLEVNNVGS